jgi:CheY-like chemotaxis protein
MAEKILVVDDEWELRNLLTEFLTGEGYDVIQASNGEEALELAEKEEPQVILLDVKMPGIDGIEVCRRLKEEDKTRFIPVIMVTALEDRDVDAFVEGADDFVEELKKNLPDL